MNARLLGRVVLILLLCSVYGISQQTVQGSVPLLSFESQADLQSIKAENATLSLSTALRSVRVDFTGGGDGVLHIASAQPSSQPRDWSKYGGVAFEVGNPSGEDLHFSVEVKDAAGLAASGHGDVYGGTRKQFFISIEGSPRTERGMVGAPPFAGVTSVLDDFSKRIDGAHVAEIVIRFEKPRAASTVALSGLLLMPHINYDRVADEFGQYTRADWPGKLKNAREFAMRRQREEAELKSWKQPAELDEFGGWAAGPQLAPGKFFRTEQREGRWWLVDPAGHVFFSLGIDVMQPDYATMVEGREKMFAALPLAGQPLAKHFGKADDVLYGPIRSGRTFDFYQANLERKYGSEYMQAWQTTAIDRLRNWGFNTIANWSDPAVFALHRAPYVVNLEIEGEYAKVSSGVDYWGKMHDVFDPKFAAAVEQSFQKAAKYKDDPLLLGYFIDNEIAWGGDWSDAAHYGLAYGALAAGAGSPAKEELVKELRAHYDEIAKLNTAWHAHIASWDQLRQPYKPSGEITDAMRQDFKQYLTAFAEQYFRTVRDALRKVDPNHLYLGCRFAWSSPEVIAASAKFVDVVSFNVYEPKLKASFCPPELKRPCIVGEFHFGGLDRGMFHPGLVNGGTQEGRAKLYRLYLQSALENPAVVGTHWFQYVDEPLTGRTLDGENYNIGFVDATDTPYPEMVEAARAVHAAAYQMHAAGGK